jgi:CheY-like chemotaxis protein/tRNA A-37 threonylcarbamoyl transferase component Bud32
MKNVLVVDDNPVVRRHMRGLLERDGCAVVEVNDGEQALAALAARTYDVMFLDLQMPKLDGIGVLLAVKERKLKIPIVLITSSDSSSEILNAFKLGAKDYLLKPFREPQVRRALQQATGLDFSTIHRSKSDVALVDRDEDLAQALRDAIATTDGLDHVDAMTAVPECAARPHQLVFVGVLPGVSAEAQADEAEALGDIVSQRDPHAALVRLLPDDVTEVPDVTVFHAGVSRRDQGRILQVVRAVRAGAALSGDRKVRALHYDGPPEFKNLYWWTLRHSVESELTRMLALSAQCTLDLSLTPDDQEKIDELVDWANAFGEARMSALAIVREPVAPPPPIDTRVATRAAPGVVEAARQIMQSADLEATSLRPSVLKVELPPPAPAMQAVTAPASPSGLLIPGLEIGERIGEGGMSVVYKATQKSLRRTVCVKLLRDEFAHDAALADRFHDEGIALATLRHPNIVSVLDVGRSDDGTLFMVMEYVEGGDLRALLKREEHLGVARSIDLVLQLLGGLAEAHGHNIIHRDLKPSNVLLTTLKDGSSLLKLVDFGIAKLVEGMKRGGQTRIGTVVGTPGYMAPEQLLGMEVTFATDLYAVGIILFELISGRRPFVARDEFELAQLTMMTPVPSLKDVVSEPVPAAVDAAIRALLAKNPKDRPQSATEVRSMLLQARQANAA